MLLAGRAPVLAAVTTLEQMSHLVCVISVVGVTSWSLSNTLVSWLMAPADAVPCVCVCVCVRAERLQSLTEFTCFSSRLVYLCARTFSSTLLYLIQYIGYLKWSAAAEPDNSKTQWRIQEKHYTVLIEPVWNWCSYIRKQWSIYELLRIPPSQTPLDNDGIPVCLTVTKKASQILSAGPPPPGRTHVHTHIHTDTTLISLSQSLMERIQLSSSGKRKKKEEV